MICGKRAWELLEKIGFTRIGGTPEELKAAEILKEACETFGVSASIEPYEVNMWDTKKTIVKTASREYSAAAMGMCGNTPEEGITGGFYYMEQMGEVEKVLAKGKIVLINGFLSKEMFQFLLDAQAKGVIAYTGDLRDSYEETDLFTTRELMESQLKMGKLPAVMMRVHDAFDLVLENPESITMIIEQDEFKANSHNVVAEIKGSEYPEEVIAFTAHYDSVEFSKGVYDNGAGSVILMELLNYFKENQPKRTVRFIWTGCEERGLYGSIAYVEKQAKDMEKIRFQINVDVGGPVLGMERISVMAEENVVSMVKNLANEVGFSCAVKQDIYSGDCIPFGEKGVPSVTFARGGAPGTSYIHNRHDTLKFMSPQALEKTAVFVLEFAKKVINGHAFAIDRKVPEVIVKKMEEYRKLL